MEKVLSGKEVSRFFRKKIKEETVKLVGQSGRVPGIACVLVGEDPASIIYVRNKEKTAKNLGFYSRIIELPTDVTMERILSVIDGLNDDVTIDAILVQLPLPGALSEREVIWKISPGKDVDCFHPENIGALWNGFGELAPCTPLGIIRILEFYGVSIRGKHAVVVGRSNIVGKPLACLLLREHATVTVCHSRTENLKEICRQADILVAAIGKPRFITGDFVKKGAVLIDVGMNRLTDGSLAGDIDFDGVQESCFAITPVPGGVGPMTITMLMNNTLNLYREHLHD